MEFQTIITVTASLLYCAYLGHANHKILSNVIDCSRALKVLLVLRNCTLFFLNVVIIKLMLFDSVPQIIYLDWIMLSVSIFLDIIINKDLNTLIK